MDSSWAPLATVTVPRMVPAPLPKPSESTPALTVFAPVTLALVLRTSFPAPVFVKVPVPVKAPVIVRV